MRFVVPLFALLAVVFSTSAALTARQSLPDCAATCLTNADTGSCGQDDDTCLCDNQAFINSTTACIESSCSGSDLQNAEAFAQQLCLAVGVTLTASSATTTSPTSPSSGAPTTSSISVFGGAVVALAVAAVL